MKIQYPVCNEPQCMSRAIFPTEDEPLFCGRTCAANYAIRTVRREAALKRAHKKERRRQDFEQGRRTRIRDLEDGVLIDRIGKLQKSWTQKMEHAENLVVIEKAYPIYASLVREAKKRGLID